MEIALIVGFSLILAVEIAASFFIYSHYIYSKNRLFTKNKLSPLWITVCILLVVLLLIASIFFAVDMNASEPLKYSKVYTILSFIGFGISAIYLVIFLIIPKLTNKNKIGYDKILTIDYGTKIAELKQKIGDVEVLKNRLATKQKHYYRDMLSYYENILNRAKNLQISKVEKLADIVTFNDTFTHKWCGFLNNYQILLTYQFCEILEKIS